MSDFSKLDIIMIPRHERPWIKSPNAYASSQDNLCEKCAILDFQVLFTRPFTHYRYPGTDGARYPQHHRLATVRHIRQTQTCSFCSLVWHAMQVNSNGQAPPDICLDGEEVDIELFSSAYGSFGLLDIYTPTREVYTIRLELSLSPRGRLSDELSKALEDFRILLHQVLDNSSCLGGLLVSTEALRYNDISDWVQHCGSAHGTSCNGNFPSRGVRILPKRLIDIANECLIEPRLDGQAYHYATLSYVWGTEPFLMLNDATKAKLYTPGYLTATNDLIPRTIRDALVLCRRLHAPHLWIDAVCIKQDDGEEKTLEIDHMDEVYAMSSCNIVAADGEHADSGLPGISRPRSHAQYSADVGGRKIANVMPLQKRLVDLSVWNQRAWTYQERLLTRRSIFFTRHQSYYQCSKMDCQEDVRFDDTVNEDQSVDESKHRMLMSPHVSFDDIDFHIYAEIARQYSTRSLTYASDILNALYGILTVMRDTFAATAYEQALPWHMLDVALLWHPVAGLQRRTCKISGSLVPSWSWAGWIGPIHYFEATMNAAERVLVPDWAALSPNLPSRPGQWLRQEDRTRWYRKIEDYGAFYIRRTLWKGQLVKSRYARPIVVPMWVGRKALINGKRQIGFMGQTASFDISLDHLRHASIPIGSRCAGDNHIACYLGVLDSNGKQCGYVVVDGNTFRTLQTGLYNFVRLSQMTLSHTEDDPAWDDDTQAFSREPGKPGDTLKYEWFTASGKPERELYFDNKVYDPTIAWCLYNVMMVEWKDGVAYRLGIGSMHITAWENSSPTTQEVVLG